jgi:AraC-like DNA-binding protein
VAPRRERVPFGVAFAAASGLGHAERVQILADSYAEYTPSGGLEPWVRCTWTRSVADGRGRQTITPDGCVDFIVYSDGRISIAGPDTGPQQANLQRGHLVGIRFRPGAAGGILGVPASALRDQRVELSEVWGDATSDLEERLAAAVSLDGQRAVLEDAVVRRVREAPGGDRLVFEAVRRLDRSACAVSELSGELGVGERQLLRRFDAAVGYGPKVLDRVLRFRRLLTALEGGAKRTLSSLAHQVGYADQAHMTRECAQLAGATPKVLYDRARGGKRP